MLYISVPHHSTLRHFSRTYSFDGRGNLYFVGEVLLFTCIHGPKSHDAVELILHFSKISMELAFRFERER